ncbi:MAG TPA: N-6 DNA methylase [Herbaspirillum sp.]|uniref:N-6 DNA methylase n=1 Tax=Herbaspirillum sp. TaxID=1890675 RepID=UPI002D73669F|nr:N-6 DNA methylase [Herbaspirillum sp.]HZG18627.1 N-6 DNA methylase [Herbaspirillum sp.]
MQWSIESDRGSADAGQFATPNWVAELLCSRLRRTPKDVVDLGVGKGALTTALIDRFPSARLIGVDNYPIPQGIQAEMRADGVSLISRDVTEPNFPGWFVRRYGKMSTVICNPPFTYLKNDPQVQAKLTALGFGATKGAKLQRMDLVFLAHALKMLKPGGEMAFILPISAFAMSRTFANLNALSRYFGLREIIALPQSVYQSADVQTAILIFRPDVTNATRSKFTVFNARDGQGIERIGEFSAEQLIRECKGENRTVRASTTLSSLGAQIARGKHSSNTLAHQGISHFHTTSFQNYPTSQIHFEDGVHPSVTTQVDSPAQEGDILIPRVGTRCLGRAAIVMRGSQYISDCVFRISAPSAERRNIWEFLSSETGRDWQLALARGACAKFITHQDLAKAPLPMTIG